ncbi:hypothetical protein O7626_39685 [Micromonospora sp. WMMD1102]|uniref:hypothetical protein n=1 Tax=Micromonospora sp. WMMD1102 TaxID=3016105 RepID=UPI0024152987|nr:hypothetical protein [Micromonospora sp. WMMD1102]MDG4791937.1 hypothetical protein [Micromonospora sp. WMMD1102]
MIAWIRSLRLWFVQQRDLRAEVLHLRREVVAVRADYERDLLALAEKHRERIAEQNETIVALERGCEDWKQRCADAEEKVRQERQFGNKAWQQVSRLKRQLGERAEVPADAF